MKTLFFLIVLSLFALSATCQDFSGTWKGTLVAPGGQLRINFHITQTDDGYSSTLDSPDQGAFGLPTTSTTVENDEIEIKMDDLMAVYKGKKKSEEQIEGTFTQVGQSFPLTIKKEKKEEE